jgi:hypothetical protein
MDKAAMDQNVQNQGRALTDQSDDATTNLSPSDDCGGEKAGEAVGKNDGHKACDKQLPSTNGAIMNGKVLDKPASLNVSTSDSKPISSTTSSSSHGLAPGSVSASNLFQAEAGFLGGIPSSHKPFPMTAETLATVAPHETFNRHQPLPSASIDAQPLGWRMMSEAKSSSPASRLTPTVVAVVSPSMIPPTRAKNRLRSRSIETPIRSQATPSEADAVCPAMRGASLGTGFVKVMV